MKSGMNANLGTAQKPLLCFVFFLAHPSPHQGEGTEEVAPPSHSLDEYQRPLVGPYPTTMARRNIQGQKCEKFVISEIAEEFLPPPPLFVGRGVQ